MSKNLTRESESRQTPNLKEPILAFFGDSCKESLITLIFRDIDL